MATPTKILLIEDSKSDQALITRAIHRFEPEASVACREDGRAVLKSSGLADYDCVLLDNRLPGVAGLDLLPELCTPAALAPPVILLTAGGSEEVAVAALQRGASDYINKSRLDSETLRRAIHGAIEKARLNRKLLGFQQRMERLAMTDELTEVGSRSAMRLDLKRRIADADRHKRRFTLMLIDLNKFKCINDQHGHLAGDQVLQGVASRLQACIRSTDSVYRYGGDEFVVLSEDIPGTRTAEILRRRIERALECEHQLLVGAAVHCRASVGIARCPMDSKNAQELLNIADQEMYRRKRQPGPARARPH